MGDSGTPSAFTKPDTPTDYPRPPYDPWAVPDGLDEAWATMYREWPGCPELTTGCTCRDLPRWYPGRPADPGCPTHGHQPPLTAAPRCSCRYFHQRTRMVIHEGRSPQSIFLVVGTGFAIDRDCLHHGDAALVYPLHSPVDPAFWDVLDEYERRGH